MYHWFTFVQHLTNFMVIMRCRRLDRPSWCLNHFWWCRRTRVVFGTCFGLCVLFESFMRIFILNHSYMCRFLAVSRYVFVFLTCYILLVGVCFILMAFNLMLLLAIAFLGLSI